MKNYNTLEGLEKYYISNPSNKKTEASHYGPDVFYYSDCVIRKSFVAFAMVNTKTLEYILRCDPINDEQYQAYEEFCEDYGNPDWIVLS